MTNSTSNDHQNDNLAQQSVSGEVACQGVGIVGYNGYSGQVLTQILLQHPSVASVTGFTRHKGAEPSTSGFQIFPLEDLTATIENNSIKCLFLATPADVSIDIVNRIKTQFVGENPSFSVIDLSGAFRLSPSDYVTFYGSPHESLENLESAVYGLCPWVSASHIQAAPVIANPGCYATSSLMALIPLLKEKIIDPKFVSIDGKSGATGAGKKLAQHLMYSELNDNCWPYRVGEHQHLPEIKRYVENFAKLEFHPGFVTHVLPLDRGLMTSIYALPLDQNASDSDIEMAIEKAFEKYYQSSPLVHWQRMTSIQDPKVSLKAVRGTAKTQLGFRVVKGRIFIFSCIDNLMKGAASQAIENWNIKLGLPSQTGLLKEF